MRILVFGLILGLAVLHAEPAATKTSLSPAAKQTLAKIATTLSGAVLEQETADDRNHGYIVKLKNDKTVFVLSAHPLAAGTKVDKITVYPMGKYDIPRDDDDRSMPKFTDDPSVAVDYLLTIAADYVGQLQPASSN